MLARRRLLSFDGGRRVGLSGRTAHLFVGDWIHDDERWETTPCYRPELAFEIAKRCDSATEHALRHVLYGAQPVDDVPADALEAIKLGVQRYPSRVVK